MTVGERLFRTHVTPVAGVVVVVPGLNNRPAVMDPLIRVLKQAGFHCLRVSLYQSQPAAHLSVQDIAERWIHDIEAAYRRIRNAYAALPVFNLSYSLGAVVSVRFLQLNTSASFHRMVLFAPALALTRGATLLRVVRPLSCFDLGLPSFAPDVIKARPTTPLKEYAAMLGMVDEVQSLAGAARIGQIRTRVFVNPKDELVSYRGVLQWIGRNTSDAWRLESIGADSTAVYEHLIVSKTALGGGKWAELVQKLRAFLREPDRIDDSTSTNA